MSAPSADSKRVGGSGVVVGVALALMGCAVLAAFLIMSRGGAVDGAALMESTFGVRGIGSRYGIVEAREMPTGACVVILDDPSARIEAASAGESPPNDERVDWGKVAILPSKAWPRRIVVTLPKAQSSQAPIDAFFTKSEWQDVSQLGSKGGKVVVDSKKLAWRGFDAQWVHERAYEQPLTFRDAMSVNLSVEGRPCVLSAYWSRGEAASEAQLKELLALLDSRK
ncbi:MAG: hypothetical protein SGI72_03140 [Planctomycetota bacterium]|nr:hypothetical protein [Planctomycetota bacterium]